MSRAFVLFGSNIEPEHDLSRAVALLRERFAVVPVAALAPDLVHPLLGVTLDDLAQRAIAADRPPVEISEMTRP